MERDGNLFNADGIDPKELENYKLVQCVAFYPHSSLQCLFYKFYFKMSYFIVSLFLQDNNGSVKGFPGAKVCEML